MFGKFSERNRILKKHENEEGGKSLLGALGALGSKIGSKVNSKTKKSKDNSG